MRNLFIHLRQLSHAKNNKKKLPLHFLHLPLQQFQETIFGKIYVFMLIIMMIVYFFCLRLP